MSADGRHSFAIAPNLPSRTFTIMATDAVWPADVSHIPTDVGRLWLAAAKDLGAMRVVGWAMSERFDRNIFQPPTPSLQHRIPRSGTGKDGHDRKMAA
jgi:putative transposase